MIPKINKSQLNRPFTICYGSTGYSSNAGKHRAGKFFIHNQSKTPVHRTTLLSFSEIHSTSDEKIYYTVLSVRTSSVFDRVWYDLTDRCDNI